MHNEQPGEVREIKRYRNRRLYDPVQGRAITQTELAELVCQGAAIRVTDHATGKDITVGVLAQVAQARTRGWSDPQEAANIYRSIIEKGGKAGMKAINNIILAGLGAISLTREKAEEIVDTLIKRGDLARGDRKIAVEDLIKKAEEEANKFADTMKQKAAELRGVRRDEYDALKAEVESLKAVIDQLKGELGQKSGA
jgi:polyhydroxyalkanoate synthesis regulator phasin